CSSVVSSTVVISLTYSRTSGKVSDPREGVRAPSATVRGLSTVCNCFVRNDQEIERPRFVEQLEGRRALAGDDVGMIIGRNDREAAFTRNAMSDGFAVVALAIVEDDFAAVFFRRRPLDRRRVGR